MTLKYFTVENTGWSNGVSWFAQPNELAYRYDSMKQALQVVEETRWEDKSVHWRVVENTFVRVYDKEGREKSSSHFKIYTYVSTDTENLLVGESHVTDKGYELSTHEKQAEFAKKRNGR